MCVALGIPVKIVCKNRTVCTGIEGLCILIRRLAYPNRLQDLSHVFGRSTAEISYIFNTVLDLIDSIQGHKMENLHQPWLSHAKLNEMVAAVNQCGAPLANCWGFIDRTVRPICRPQSHQQFVFNGHKRVHGLKFQCITTPDGMIAHVWSNWGPPSWCRYAKGKRCWTINATTYGKSKWWGLLRLRWPPLSIIPIRNYPLSRSCYISGSDAF